MAPTIAVDAGPTQADGSTIPPIPVQATDAPLAAFGQPARLPHPAALRALLIEQLHAGVDRVRNLRGPVTQPEDTHTVIRDLQVARNHAAALIAALQEFDLRCEEMQIEELETAVGVDAGGVPDQSMDVPFDGETIKLTREFEATYTTDLDQLLVAVRELVAMHWEHDGRPPAADPDQFARECQLVLHSDVMRKTVPSSKGVAALAATLGHHGKDDAAAIARGAHQRGRPVYKGVKITVVTPTTPTRPPMLTRHV